MTSPATGPFRRLLQNYAPPWMLQKYSAAVSLGMVGLLGDLLGEAAMAAVRGAMLTDTDSPPDAVQLKGRDAQILRVPLDTVETYRQRVIEAWDAWTFAGTRDEIERQLRLLGYSDLYVRIMGEDDWYGDGDSSLPRRFWVVVSVENEDPQPDSTALATQIYRLANHYRSGEERVENVTVMTLGRTFDLHPLTGLQHTFDDPGPGIDTFDASVGVTYR